MNAEVLGKYTLVRHIATGGMAEIWLAEQTGPGGFNKELVIKRILPHLAKDKHFTDMFLDEARLVAQLTHPHIGQIFELGEIEGSYFIAMEYIDGVDLSKLMLLLQGMGQAIPIENAVRIVCDVLAALEYAHEFTDRDGTPLGLVHRDISPQNVLVSNDGAVKLVDFGVAKAADNSAKTQAGGIKGKFAYMAPEQIQNESALDRRVDIFAVGVLLYELLTFVKPFGDELLAVSQILQSEAPDPRTYRPEVPEQLVQIIYRALAKNRDERYQSADMMLADLEGFLYQSNLAVSARELSVFIRQVRGLPTPRTTVRAVPESAGSRPPIVAPPAVPVVPVTTPEVGIFAPPEAQQETASGATSSGGVYAIEQEVSRRQPLLIAGFLALMLLIVGAFLVLGYLVINRGADEPVAQASEGVQAKQTVAVGAAQTDTKQEQPASVFRHSGNTRTVYISTKPGTTIWYKGEKVGESSVQTTLRPGTYEVELRYEGNRRLVSFDVESSKFINRISF